MRIIEIIIQNLVLFYFLVVYIGITIGLLCTEKFMLTKKNQNNVKILLVVVAVISVISFILIPAESFNAGCEIMKIEIDSEGENLGTQIVAIERNGNSKNLICIGEFVSNEGDNSKYIDVQLDDGSITCPSNPEYAKLIEDTLQERGISTNDYTGKSCIYQELVVQVAAINSSAEPSGKLWILKGCVVFVPELMLILQYIIFIRKNQKEKMNKKMMLEDL